MKIIEKKIKNGFSNLFSQRKKKRMLQYKFKDEFLREQKRLSLEGNIVISVGLFGHSGDDEVWSDGKKEMMDDMHKRKIDMSDEIFVINKNGYIGSSTKSEIEYAIKTNKPVNYMEPINK